MLKMVIYGWLGIFALALGVSQTNQPRYAVSLVSTTSSQALADKKESRISLEQDRQTTYRLAMKYLSKSCRFFNEAVHRESINRLYRENPDLDPTNVQNIIAQKLPTKLIVFAECRVSSIADPPFPLLRHQSQINMRVVDKSDGEIYVQESASSKQILLPPLKESPSLNSWRINRRSRDLAIEVAIKNLVPKLLQKMAKKQSQIQSFKFIAVRLTENSKKAIWDLLNQFGTAARVSDIRNTTDNGVEAKVSCPSGIYGFLKLLNKNTSKNLSLKNMLADTDGFSVKMSPKEQQTTPISTRKFEGRLILSADQIKIKALNLASFKDDHAIFRDRLQQTMQNNFEIYDASALWETLQRERQRLQQLASTNPTDFLAQKFSLATHTLYYWSKTNFKQMPQGRYCFGEIGVRIVRMVNAQEIAYFRLSSAEEFGRGVKVIRDDAHARRVSLTKLAQRAVQKIIEKLNGENPEQFRVDVPRIRIKAANFSTAILRKLNAIFAGLESDKIIKFESQIEGGTEYFQCHISFPKGKKTHTLPSFRQYLIEECLEEGFGIHIQSDVGQIFLTPAEEGEDE